METITMTIPIKNVYCSANPNRQLPQNVMIGERIEPLITDGNFKAGDLVALHHDIFFEDVVLYIDPENKTDSMLIRSVDYALEDEDSIATDQSGWRCYQKIKVLKDQTAIYADYIVYGDFIDCNIFNQQIALSKDAREDITRLQKGLTSAQDRLNDHEPRIITAENNIRSNTDKINHNSGRIEQNDSDIKAANREIATLKTRATRLEEELFPQEDGQEVTALQKIRTSIGEEQKARESYIATTDGRLDTIEGKIKESNRSINEIRSQLSAIMPIGFCYLQPKDTSLPSTLWPDFEWEQIGPMTEPTTWKRTR